MTDTTPSDADITRAADGLYAALPAATRVIGDLSSTWPVMAGRLAALLADDAMPADVRIVRARATLAAREVVADRVRAEAATDREARPAAGPPLRSLADRITAGDFDWLVAVFDQGEVFQCGLCGDRVRAFEDDESARSAARLHLIDQHAEQIAELDGQGVDLTIDEDDRCQPIGCDAGYHLPGCQYIERDTPAVAGPVYRDGSPVVGDPDPAWNSTCCSYGHQHSTPDNAYACDMLPPAPTARVMLGCPSHGMHPHERPGLFPAMKCLNCAECTETDACSATAPVTGQPCVLLSGHPGQHVLQQVAENPGPIVRAPGGWRDDATGLISGGLVVDD